MKPLTEKQKARLCRSKLWRPVAIGNWGLRYQVHPSGQVRNIRRPEHLLAKDHFNGTTEGSYWLSDGKVQQRITCARLVMATFVGPRPEGKVVGRRNWDRFDDRRSNLYYTDREYVRDRFYRVCTRSSRGELHPRHKLTEEAVRLIRKSGERGVSHEALAIEYGVSRSTIDCVVALKSWKHVTLNPRKHVA